MLNKIKGWSIGGKIAGGIVGGIVALFLLLTIIAFVGGMIRGIRNGPQETVSPTQTDYYSFMNTMLPKLDSDCTNLASEMNQIESGDTSQSIFNQMENDRQSVAAETILIKAYDGTIPPEYQTINEMITNSMNELNSAVSQLGMDALEVNQPDIASTIGTDAAKFNEAKRAYTAAFQDMQQIHNNKN